MNKSITVVLLVAFLFPSFAHASEVLGNFFVTPKNFDFSKSIAGGKCTGQIPYPVLEHDEEELIGPINAEILDFVELYAICNQGARNNFSVHFELPQSDIGGYFSINWITKKDKKLYRIDSLTFNFGNANLVQVDDIFNPLSSELIKEIAKLSQGNLPENISWEQFLDKIGKRDVQFYIKDSEWYLVFNGDKVVEVKIPEYFLRDDGGDV